jgi:flagellar capping protein FliD
VNFSLPFFQITLPLMVTILVVVGAAIITAWVSNANMAKRIDDINNRINDLGKRIDDLAANMNTRFAAIEAMLGRIEDRLIAVEKKVEVLEVRPFMR